MDCEFTGHAKGDRCRKCGFVLHRDFSNLPHRTCKVVCRHLGERLGDATVTVHCVCKNKEIERRYAVHACALFGETLPSYSCTKEALSEAMDREGVATCWGCESFSVAIPQRPNMPVKE